MCVQTTLNDLKVFYSLGSAELSPSSGPSPWNIHAAAKENQWKELSGGARLLTENGVLPLGLEAGKNALSIECVLTKILSSEGATFSEPESICSGYLSFNESPWSEKLCLGALRHLLVCFVPLEEELWSIGWSLAFMQQGWNPLFPLEVMTLPFGWHRNWTVPDFKRLRGSLIKRLQKLWKEDWEMPANFLCFCSNLFMFSKFYSEK